MADKLYHYSILLRDGRKLQAVSNKTFNSTMQHIKNDRFVEFNGLAVESEQVTFLQDVTPLGLVKNIDEPNQERITRKRITRNGQNRLMRSTDQIDKENDVLVKILANHGQPMALSGIINSMKVAGFDWNNNNACGHVKHAIRNGWNVERVGYGMYQYKGGEAIGKVGYSEEFSSELNLFSSTSKEGEFDEQ